MIVENVWKLTNTVRVELDARSSHTERQSTFPDNVCSYCPPCHGVSHCENCTTFLFLKENFHPSGSGEETVHDLTTTSTDVVGVVVGDRRRTPCSLVNGGEWIAH
jgi:hypothetical protein